MRWVWWIIFSFWMSGWYGRCVVGFQEIYLTVAWALLSLKRSHRYTEIVGETRTPTVGGYVFRRVHANSVNLRVYNFKDLSFSIFWIEWHRELQVGNNGTKEYFRSHASPFYTIGTPSTPTNWPVSTPNSQLPTVKKLRKLQTEFLVSSLLRFLFTQQMKVMSVV